MQSKRLLWGILGIALICGVFVFSACPTESDDTSGGNTTQGGNGTNTGGNGTNTGGNGTNTGDKGDDTGGNGTNTGGNGTNTGGNGTNTGGNGTNTGGNGTNTGGSGDNTGGNGDNTGGSGTNTGGNGTNTGGGGGTSYTVTFNGNGGTSPASETVNAGSSITLPSTTRSGYTLNGWYTSSSGGTKAGNAGASYTPSASVTLYAQWTQSGGGGGTSGPQQPYDVSLIRSDGRAQILMTFNTSLVSKSEVDTYTFTIQYGGSSGSSFMDVYTYTPPNTAAVTTGLPAGWDVGVGATNLSGSDYQVLVGVGPGDTGERYRVKITKGTQSIYTEIKTY